MNKKLSFRKIFDNRGVDYFVESTISLSQPILDTSTTVSKIVLEFGTDAALPFAKFLPLINDLSKVYETIIKLYQTAEHNKKICGVLLDRVTEAAVRNLKIRRDDNQKFFTEQNYLILRKLLGTIHRIKNFTNDISQLTGLRKYFQAKSIEQTFQELTNDFDSYMRILNFSMIIKNQFQTEKDKQVLKEDVDALTKYLNEIEGGITDTNKTINVAIEEVAALKHNFEKSNSDHISSKSREQLQLKELINDEPLQIDDFYPPEKKIGKKVYLRKRKCDQLKFTFKEVPIKDSNEIIRFYGLATDNEVLYLVTEWMENGCLREYYKSNPIGIDLNQKICFALDISRGLNYLTSVKILHHDISSENIFISLQNRAKIANFGLSRGFTDATRNIKANIQNIRYMSPEKMIDSTHVYDVKCEVYR
ncbi:897_t:CDS:2 [Diversispora eburnea]|uniref:897_t:CDS:1 n=1 Tax=Diversispora eburnea TaxID=1213867 RepID=A0A9N9AUG5_9GLOM|nr:897_t:CDS:2 [Diversispora eburnea]